MSEKNPRNQTTRFARQQALQEWGAAGENARFLLSTRPVYDTRSITGTVISTDLASGVSYVKFTKGTQVVFFSSELGKTAPLGGDTAHAFNESDTNLTSAREAPGGNSEQVIEALGLVCRGCNCTYAAPANFTASTDDVVLNALLGKSKLVDPSGLVKPPELESPMMLENTIFQALLSSMTIELSFDNADRNEKLCTLDAIPQGAGGSFLRSNGTPETGNRFEFPEGYRWKRSGSTDSANLVAVVTLREDVVVAITPVTAPVLGTVVAPTHVHVLMRLSAFGLNIRQVNSN